MKEDCQESSDGPGCQFHDSQSHGLETVAAALHGVPVDEDHAQGDITGNTFIDIDSCPWLDSGKIDIGIEKEADQRPESQYGDSGCYYAVDHNELHGIPGPLFDPVHGPVTVILAGIGSHGLPDRYKTLGKNVLGFACGGECCHSGRPESIDG